MPANQGVDFLLRQMEEDHSLLKGCFRDPRGALRARMPLFSWNSWPLEKAEILQRLVRRGLVEMRYLLPSEEDFPFWLLTLSSSKAQQDLEQLRQEYLQIGGVSVIFLTEEGKIFLKNLRIISKAG